MGRKYRKYSSCPECIKEASQRGGNVGFSPSGLSPSSSYKQMDRSIFTQKKWGQTELCGEKMEPTRRYCKKVISSRDERDRCEKDAKELLEGVELLTKDFSKKLNEMTEKCADKSLTEKEFKKCMASLAQESQEYIAQCSTFAAAMDLNFSQKTVAGVAKKMGKQFLGQLKSIFPASETKAAEASFLTWIGEWVQNCNKGLRFRFPIEDEQLTCERITKLSSDEKKMLAKKLAQKGNN